MKESKITNEKPWEFGALHAQKLPGLELSSSGAELAPNTTNSIRIILIRFNYHNYADALHMIIDNIRPMDWKHVTCAHII